MIRFFPYVLKTLWRHRLRTGLTVGGSAVALFVYCVVGAIEGGFDGLDDGSTGRLVVFQANRFCPATSHLPQDYEEAIRRVEGVGDVVPIQVFTNNCRASLDVIVFHGFPPERLRAFRDFTLVQGDFDAFAGRRDAALVGRAVAARRELSVGDRFTIGKLGVTVSGVFASPRRAEENMIYTHLDFLQRTPGLNAVGTVTQFEVALAEETLDEGADAAAVCSAVDDRFRFGPVATDTRSKGAFEAGTLADLAELVDMIRMLGYACLGLVFALVATTTLMAVGDRVREHAVLQTLGFTPWRVFGLVLAECVLTGTAGGVAGVGSALAILASSDLAVGAEAVTIAVRPSVALAARGVAVAALVGLAAGVLPAWRAAHADVVHSLRSP